jgi:GT2 family glycosyltransferase
MSVADNRPHVVAIVLNTNRRVDTLECLASLQQQTTAAIRVIVLDNHSQDGSVEAIRSAFPAAEVLELESDRGYAGNNNVGIQKALTYSPEWILVLNEDTVLDPACVARLLEAGAGDPRVGIVGPLILHHDEPSVIQSAGGRLGRFWESTHEGANQEDRGQFRRIRQVEWVSGCALMIRRQAVVECGMLDERFYYYWEETEWCLRAARRGWRVVNAPDARIWHKGAQRNYRPGANVSYYSTRNRFLLMSTQSAPLQVRAIAWYQTLRTLISWSVRPKWRSQRPHRDAMLEGIRDFVAGRWGARPL